MRTIGTIVLAFVLTLAAASFDSPLHLTGRGAPRHAPRSDSTFDSTLHLTTSRGCAFVAPPRPIARVSTAAMTAYVPDGLTAEQYAKVKTEDAKRAKAGENLGKLGISKFEWRTMKAWQESGQKHQFAAQLSGAKSQPYMRASYKRPAVKSQFLKAERDFAEGQNAAAGGTWLEGFLNDGIKKEQPKAKKNPFARR